MHKKMKKQTINYLMTLLLTTILLSCNGQKSMTKSEYKSLTEQVNWLGFLEIKISFGAEYYDRNEINIIYLQDGALKIHSFLKSNYSRDKQIDTCFKLSIPQLMTLNKFGDNFDNNTLPSGIVIAGTSALFEVSFNGQTKTRQNKSDYSLINDLLNLDKQ